MPETICLQVPPDAELDSREGWRAMGDSTFAAARAHIVVVKRRGRKILKGPPVKVLELPGASTYKVEHKNARVVKHGGEIQRSIQQTVSAKLAVELAQKLAAEIGVSGVLPSSKLSGEVQAKAGAELTAAVQQTLAEKRSFEVQDTEEITRSVTFAPPADGKRRDPTVLSFYLGLWPWSWDFYLFRVEYLRLRHKRNWIWPDVRKTMSHTSVDLRLPLFSVRVLEPQDEYSMCEGGYEPDVGEDDEVLLSALNSPPPNMTCPDEPRLEDLAKLAFPVTREERKRAASRRVTGARKARKAPAKKAAGTKTAARRKSARQAARRRAPARRR